MQLQNESLLRKRFIMKEFFELKELSYRLLSHRNYSVPGIVRTTHIGFQSIKYLAPKIWDLIPDQIKHCASLKKFKHFINSWSPNNFSCQLRKK